MFVGRCFDVTESLCAQDVAAKIMDFSQQGPRAVCIISAIRAVSIATLLQIQSGGVVTYEGMLLLVIICLKTTACMCSVLLLLHI